MSGQPEVLRTALAVRRHLRMSPAELRGFQDRALRRLVQHAYDQVPYYRALFDRHRLHPRHIRGTRDIELLPFTSKDEMRRRPERERLAMGLDPERLLRVRTSGSSGEPFTIRRTWIEDKVQYLLRLRTFRLLGIHPRDRLVAAGLTGRPGPGDPKYIGRALSALGIHRKQKVDALQQPDVVLRQLASLRPDVLIGFPGMLDRLTAPELAPLRAGVRPHLIFVGGEVLTAAMRARLRRAFEAPVVESYASHEFPLMAWSCPHGPDLHVADDGVLLEVLRNGRPVLPGERGEVVVTNLHAYAMPFIRYRLGDLATRGDTCSCGQPFSTIGAVQGRMLDYFPLPDGRLLHPYEIVTRLVWGPSDWISRYQLVQERTDRIVLRVVASAPPAERIAELEKAVRPLLGPAVTFTVELVDEIPLTDGGKLRPSRSLVRSEYDDVAWPSPRLADA
jgi:phenylacetate-coenzyme A ligase PaaK-like adenylate-forming protein